MNLAERGQQQHSSSMKGLPLRARVLLAGAVREYVVLALQVRGDAPVPIQMKDRRRSETSTGTCSSVTFGARREAGGAAFSVSSIAPTYWPQEPGGMLVLAWVMNGTLKMCTVD